MAQISYKYTSPNFWKATADDTIKGIVLHGTASPTQNTGLMGAVNWLTNPTSDVSSHYIIDLDGTIYCLIDPYKGLRAWANGALNKPDMSIGWIAECVTNHINPNRRTISIEHVAWADDMTNHRVNSMPVVQALASLWLCDKLLTDFKLPRNGQTVVGHYQIDSVTRPNCPGVIDIANWNNRLKAGHVTNNGTNNFTDQDVISLNGCIIGHGFLARYKQIGNGDLIQAIINVGLPLTNEITGPDGVTRQVFEGIVFEYFPPDKFPSIDQNWRVTRAHAGREYWQNHPELFPGSVTLSFMSEQSTANSESTIMQFANQPAPEAPLNSQVALG